MDSRQSRHTAGTADPLPGSDAIDFVRFCYRRRRVGWPDLYDEMCAVAARGLYRGFGPDDLSQVGIGFCLDDMPALALLVARVVSEDVERRRITAGGVRESFAATAAAADAAIPSNGPSPASGPEPDPGRQALPDPVSESAPEGVPSFQLAVATV
jgi:hypothetical protein